MADVEDGTGGGAPDTGRRKLLKIAAAAGGAIAATAILPGTWSKPIAQIGALPAHAQTSDVPITLTNAVYINDFETSPPVPPDQVGFEPPPWRNIQVQCEWENPLAPSYPLDGGTYLHTSVTNIDDCDTNATFASGYATGIYPYWHISTNPDGTTGTMVFNVVTPCFNGTRLEWWVTEGAQSSYSPSNPYVTFAI